MTITANPGYVLAQLEKALGAAAGHESAEVRRRAGQRVERWRQALAGMLSGSIDVGSRTPVAGAPAWATLEVSQGGFATGNLLAGGALQAHEIELQRRIGAAGTSRAALNLHYLSDAGRAELREMLASGCYRVQVPEEGALLVVTWLLDHGQAERARELLDEIMSFTDRLRFYPIPSAQPLLASAVAKLRTAAETARELAAVAPQKQVAKMNEALAVWAPLLDRAVALFLETVEGETPRLRTDAAGALVRKPNGQPLVDGGWPCKRFPAGWSDRAKALLFDHEHARAAHKLCGKPENSKENFAILRRHLETCARSPSALGPLDIGRIRSVLAACVTKRGVPGEARHGELRAAQARSAARPLNSQVARVLAARLSECPEGSGIAAIEPMVVPVSEAEAKKLGIGAGAAVPEAVAKKLDRCLEAPIEELVQRGVIPSSEVLAIVLPQITGQVTATGLADAALARLYAATYSAFRRRRSLLLLNLQSQVRLQELPWVAAIEAQRQSRLAEQERARQALEQVAVLALTSFPQTILPNKLLQEMRALVGRADLDLPLCDELAADIFMGEFSTKFVAAAQIAARLLRGSLYARYYDLPVDKLLSIADLKQARPEYGAASSRDFFELCKRRAEVGRTSGGRSVAQSGKIIEQEQVLTTHNLAALQEVLGLERALRTRAVELAQGCFRFICKQEQIKTVKFHARLVRVKNSAYSWRQMLFFLSLAGDEQVQGFLDWAAEHLGRQSPAFRERFWPALKGLTIVAAGGDLDRAVNAGEARRFLGWTTERHWLLAPG